MYVVVVVVIVLLLALIHCMYISVAMLDHLLFTVEVVVICFAIDPCQYMAIRCCSQKSAILIQESLLLECHFNSVSFIVFCKFHVGITICHLGL